MAEPSGANDAEPVLSILQRLETSLASESDSPRREAELLVEHVTGLGRQARYLRGTAQVGSDQRVAIDALLQRRLAGEPIAYLLGTQGFRHLLLQVTPAVLIPRPETELLVERCLHHLGPQPADACVADLGTGSGAVALALAHERPGTRICAVDRSSAALAVARANGSRLGLSVEWLEGDWLHPLAGRRFTLIAANPPYVADDDPHLAQGDVRFEPRTALTAGADGLDDIRHIIRVSRGHLLPGGWLVLEHGHDQGSAVQGLLRQAGYAAVTGHRDLAGHLRIAEGQQPPSA